MSLSHSAPASSPGSPTGIGLDRLREDLIHADPLLDCLLEVCRMHGRPASRASLSAGLPLVDGRLTLACVDRAAQRAGLSAKVQRRALQALDTAALPIVLILEGDQACVLVDLDAPVEPDAADAPGAPRSSGYAKVLLPETGSGVVSLPRAELAQRYTGVALFLQPSFRFDERSPEVRATRSGHWFWSAVLSQRFVYRDVIWAALLINVFAVAFPLFTRVVYDRVVPNNAVETLWALTVGMLLVFGADLSMKLLRSHFVDEASARIDVKISSTIMERVLGMRLENRPESVGSFAANLRGFEQVREFIASSTVTALIDLPFVLIFIVLIASISIWLAVPVVVCFVIVLVVGYVLQHRLHELSQTTYQAGALRNATLVESLIGIETIKSQGAESTVQSRWESVNSFLAGLNVQMRALSSTAVYGTNSLQQLVSLSMIVIGVYLISQHELTTGALIACTMLSGRALAPAGQIVGLLMQYQGARTALESLDNIMKRPLERAEDSTYIHRRELSGAIEFRNVSFSYPDRSESALDGVSFRINPGEKVAFIGKVGSGKTTLQKLVLGLYQPKSGAVLLDGIDLRQLDPADLRRNVGYVSQDVTLFWGSLRDNITLGMPYAQDADVLVATEQAGLSEFVNRSPNGFDMQVGERGELLSGGQRQAVGIARAVLHNAPILLLDEPTSAMDFSSEAQVTARLTEFARDKTVLLVTHRTSMLALVDRVIVVDNGKIVADGPREPILQALASGRIARAN